MLSIQKFNHCLSDLESRSFQIEVLTSGHEEITVVRLSPKAVQQAVEETFRKNIKVSNNYSLFWKAASVLITMKRIIH